MNLKKLGQIRLEDIANKVLRGYFGVIVGALAVLVILGVVLGILGSDKTPDGHRHVAPGWILAAMGVLFLYRAWSRKRMLDREPEPPPAQRPALPFPLALADSEPPEARPWARGRIEFSSGIQVADRWIWTLVAVAVCGLFGYAHQSVREDTNLLDPANLPLLCLALVPLGCLVWAIAGTLRHRKMGRSAFQMDDQPSLGRPLTGTLEVPASVPVRGGLKIELLCLRQDSDGPCALERILEQKEQPVIDKPSAVRRPLKLRVSIPIPSDCLPTATDLSGESIRWVLAVRAPASGFQAEFEVPVKERPV